MVEGRGSRRGASRLDGGSSLDASSVSSFNHHLAAGFDNHDDCYQRLWPGELFVLVRCFLCFLPCSLVDGRCWMKDNHRTAPSPPSPPLLPSDRQPSLFSRNVGRHVIFQHRTSPSLLLAAAGREERIP